MIIAVDMDGTIVKDKWPEIGPLRLGAKWCMNWILSRGHQIIINTCRENELLIKALEFMLDNDINWTYSNENTIERTTQYGGDCRKISADWYIDDRAGFLGWWSIPIIILCLEWRNRHAI